MNGPYAFLSYVREDEAVVTGLKRILELNGIAAWQDRTELKIGENLEKGIEKAVQGCAWLVPVVSKHTSRSGWVFREFNKATKGRAKGTRRPQLVYPVVIADDGQSDPRSVLQTSWFGDRLDSYVNALVSRQGPEARDLRDLISALKQNWPEFDPARVHEADLGAEAAARRLLWSTFPSRFSQLERRFHNLVADAKSNVWVLVGLPSSGKSALLGWLQARCPFATRIDLGSTRYGTLEQRLPDVVVEVIMYDNVWDEGTLLQTLSAVERHRLTTRLQVVTCTPNLLAVVEDRLRRIGANYSVDHERGLGYTETRRLVEEQAKDETFRKRLRELIASTDAPLSALESATAHNADPSAAAPTNVDWTDAESVSTYLWRHIKRSWVPFNPPAFGHDPHENPASTRTTSPCVANPDGALDLDRSERHEGIFSSSLYEASHRLQHFGELDTFDCESGLPLLEAWKLDYIRRAFTEGLSVPQQRAVRNVVRFDGNWMPESAEKADLELLERCGVVTQRGTVFRISDRVFAQYFVPPIVIHHLSDFHLSTQPGAKPPPTLEAYTEEILADDTKCPHLIVVSGDLFSDLYMGEEHPSARREHPVRDWFKRAKARLLGKRHPFVPLHSAPRILVVGGNQDVDPIVGDPSNTPAFWSACRRRQTLRHLLSDVAVHPYSETPDASGAEPDLAKVYKVGPLRFALIDSCAYGTDHTHEQSPAWWLDALYGLLLLSKKQPDVPSSQGAFPDTAVPIGGLRTMLGARSSTGPASGFIAGLCSLIADDRASPRTEFMRKVCQSITDCEPGYVSTHTLSTLQKLASAQRESARSVVTLAVLHHALSSAPRDSAVALSELLNAGHVREVLANAQVALALHGHLHMHWVDEFKNPLRSDWLLRTVAAPAFGGNHENDALGFNEVRVRWEGPYPRILQRAVTRHAGAWVPGRAYEFSPGTHEEASLDGR